MRPLSEQEKYLKSKVSHTPRVVHEIEQQLLNDNKWGINVSPAEGAFLRFLVEAMSCKRVMEIGTQYGYSTHWMLDANVDGLEIVTLEKEVQHFETANKFFAKVMGDGKADSGHFAYENEGKKLSSYCGDANELLAQHKDPFDMVFIDANKGGYLTYLDWCLDNLNSGGWVIADNTFLFGSVWLDEPGDLAPKNPWKKMKEFNERLSNSKAFRSFMLPTPEGLSIAQKI